MSHGSMQALRDLLLLANRRVPIGQIRRWSPRARAMAERWAVQTYLYAADNNVHVSPEPRFLAKFPRAE